MSPDLSKLVFGQEVPVNVRTMLGLSRGSGQFVELGKQLLFGSPCDAINSQIDGLPPPEVDLVNAAIDEAFGIGAFRQAVESPESLIDLVADTLKDKVGLGGLASAVAECTAGLMQALVQSWEQQIEQTTNAMCADPDEAERVWNRLQDESTQGRGKIADNRAVLDWTQDMFQNPGGSCEDPTLRQAFYGRIRGPWDPNDKNTNTNYHCDVGEAEGETDCVRNIVPLANATDPIEYVIHFENKADATAPAADIVITDVLDTKLDPATLQIITSSHPDVFSAQVVGDTVTFQFAGINLPPNVNAPEGEGFVQFSVRPVADWLPGAEIRNHASIVFDFNPPIETPEVVHVLDSPPDAADDAATTDEDTVVDVDVLANDADGNDDPFEVASVTQPTHGAAAINVDGTVRYRPEANYNGPDYFSYAVRDVHGVTDYAGVSMSVVAVNDPPALVDPGDQTNAEGDAVSLQLQAIDPEGAAPTFGADGLPPGLAIDAATGLITGTSPYTAAGSYQVTVSASDGSLASSQTFTWTVANTNRAPAAEPDDFDTYEDRTLYVSAPGVLGNDTDADNDAFAAALVDLPAHGTLTLNSDGSFVYAPDLDFNGTDSFSYTAGDGSAASNVAVALISVGPVNDAPEAVADGYSTDEDTRLSVETPGVLGNDGDVDGDPLTAVLVAGPSSGSLTFDPSGTFTYAPDANVHGTDSFTYKVSDGTVESEIVTVTIAVDAVNDVPAANNQSVATPEDTALLTTLTGSDIDGDLLQFRIVTPPSHGTLGALAVTGPNTATVTYVPWGDFYGEDSFLFSVSDETASSSNATVAVTVSSVNDGPVANAQSVTTDEDTAVSVTLTGSDPEGHALVYAVATAPAHGQLFGAPPALAYEPASDFFGTDRFTFTVTDVVFDGEPVTSAPATVDVTIRPVNDGPIATGFSTSTRQDTPKALTLLGSDPEGDPLAFMIATLPANGTLGPVLGDSVTYTPVPGFQGLDSFTFTVSDGRDVSAPATVVITVTAAEYRCPLSQGYWKSHPAAWLATALTLGSQTYAKADLLGLLAMPPRGDAGLILAHQLIAAKLSLANGGDPAPVSATIAQADALLSLIPTRLPYEIKPSSILGRAMVGAAGILERYNSGQLTPGCIP